MKKVEKTFLIVIVTVCGELCGNFESRILEFAAMHMYQYLFTYLLKVRAIMKIGKKIGFVFVIVSSILMTKVSGKSEAQ